MICRDLLNVMVETSLHRLCNDTENDFHIIFQCNGQPHSLHIKSILPSDNNVMSRKLIPPDIIYLCNVIEGRGILKIFHWNNLLCNHFCTLAELIPPEDFFVMLLPMLSHFARKHAKEIALQSEFGKCCK